MINSSKHYMNKIVAWVIFECVSMQTCHMNVILIVPQMDDDIGLFSYEDDFGDLDEIPLTPSGDQLVSGMGTFTMQTQTSQVSRFMCIQ